MNVGHRVVDLLAIGEPIIGRAGYRYLEAANIVPIRYVRAHSEFRPDPAMLLRVLLPLVFSHTRAHHGELKLYNPVGPRNRHFSFALSCTFHGYLPRQCRGIKLPSLV